MDLRAVTAFRETLRTFAQRPHVRRGALIGAPILLVLVLVLGHRAIFAAWVRHRAAGLGVELAFGDFELGSSALTLRRATAKLEGVNGLRVTAARVKLTTRGLAVASVEAADVSVSLEGSATDRVLELAAWSGDHTDTYRLPGSASAVRVEWRAAAGAAPWLTASGGALTADGKAARFTASSATAGGVPLGAMSAGFVVAASGVTVELGKGASGDAPITARLTTQSRPPRVEITLRPVRLETLGAALGLALPAPGATASGRAELTLGKRGRDEAIQGSADLLLDGWTPPHPRELSGIIGGKKTTVALKLAVAPNRSKVSLSDVVLRAGKFELKGTGAVTRAADHALAKLDLKGPIACSDLVRSAAKDRFGLLGELAGDAASGAATGSVIVNVTVEADSRDLRNAKIKPKVGVGCGLKLPF